MPDANIKALVDAGLIQAANLTNEDRELIDRLSDQEVRTLIDVARRLYPGDPTVLKVVDLRSGRPRICIPL